MRVLHRARRLWALCQDGALPLSFSVLRALPPRRPTASPTALPQVHNGIEYGDMQILAEGASFARVVGGLSPMQLSDLLSRYSHGLLDSFLLEITAMLYRKEDDRAGAGAQTDPPASGPPPVYLTPLPLRRAGGRPLVDSILDSCGSKGTGKWTVQQVGRRTPRYLGSYVLHTAPRYAQRPPAAEAYRSHVQLAEQLPDALMTLLRLPSSASPALRWPPRLRRATSRASRHSERQPFP